MTTVASIRNIKVLNIRTLKQYNGIVNEVNNFGRLPNIVYFLHNPHLSILQKHQNLILLTQLLYYSVPINFR